MIYELKMSRIMNIIRYPERPKWKELLKRSALHTEDLRETVCKIL